MKNLSMTRTAALGLLAAIVMTVPATAQSTATASGIQSLASISSVERVEELATFDQSGDTAARAAAVARMGEWLGTIDQVRGGIARGDGFIRSDDDLVLALLLRPMEGESMLLRRYMTSVVAAMESVPDTFYATLDAKVAALWSEVRRVAATVKPVTGVEADAATRSAIVNRVTAVAPEATVVRTLLAGDRWVVKTSELGVPKSEYRKGYVMYQVPGVDLVVCQQILVERPYVSRGNPIVKLGHVRLQMQP